MNIYSSKMDANLGDLSPMMNCKMNLSPGIIFILHAKDNGFVPSCFLRYTTVIGYVFIYFLQKKKILSCNRVVLAGSLIIQL